MGLIDRDYMQDRDLRPTEGGSFVHWFWIIPLACAVLLVLHGPPQWVPERIAVVIHQVRTRLGLPPLSGNGPQAPAATFAEQSQTSGNVVRRCVVNGVQVDVLNAACPPSAPQAPVVQRVAPMQSAEATSNPFMTPGTIYRCKSLSNAGMFWSQAHCRQHNALIDRIASVPTGISFQQQVDIADAEARNVESSLRREQSEGQRSALCTSLRNEREAIWKRSGSGSGYTPLQQVDADQVRWKQIKSQMASNGCGP